MVAYGPRISAGASGFGSHVSIWLGPPESQNRMTAFWLVDRGWRARAAGCVSESQSREPGEARLEEPPPAADAEEIAAAVGAWQEWRLHVKRNR